MLSAPLVVPSLKVLVQATSYKRCVCCNKKVVVNGSYSPFTRHGDNLSLLITSGNITLRNMILQTVYLYFG